MHVTGCLLSLWHLDTHMQLKTMIPHQDTRPAVFWQAQRQYDAPLFTSDCLRRPMDRVELLLDSIGELVFPCSR